ncbi:hypothetical protein N665_0754s0011 [Sinapis alba]|nr:hypothetical protein N665_0754s0011 [Sinapis alba]
MSPGQSKLPSDSIKVIPGRSKLRVESSNPVARGNPVPRPSKVKLITPEEAIKLHSGVSQVPVSPPSESSRPYNKPARPAFESRLQPVPATFESKRHVPAGRTPEAPRHVPPRPTSKPPRPVPPRPTSKPPRPVAAPPAEGFRKEIVCGLRAASSVNTTTVRQRTNPRSLLQPRTVQRLPSLSALQFRSRFQQEATTDATTHTTEVSLEIVVEVGDKAKDNGSKETCRSTSEERISELLLYRPALLPTWKGRIVDSATLLPEFDCQFCANPASNISRKALRLSKSMPIFLEVELVPTGHILNDVFGRIPKLSDVELYFFSDEKETKRSKREHAHLFEAMVTRNAMIKASVNGTELLLFSSKLLDKTSQFFIKKQTKTENYLWGFFLHNKKYPQAHALDDGNVVDVDMDTEDQTPGLSLQPIAESQSTSSSSQRQEGSLPPGFEKIWTPPSSRPCGSSGERPSCS